MMMAPPLLPLLLSYPLLRSSSSFFLSLCKPVHYGDNDGGPAAREEAGGIIDRIRKTTFAHGCAACVEKCFNRM
uniref:B1340F09.8 protein n=2 Tax=Oryza TaxID=4527 RepID=Q6MW75_ORYSJ|nr:B1340F09.8 [Oryza sativa Japonica Group]